MKIRKENPTKNVEITEKQKFPRKSFPSTGTKFPTDAKCKTTYFGNGIIFFLTKENRKEDN